MCVCVCVCMYVYKWGSEYYIYIYIYMCVCMYVYKWGSFEPPHCHVVLLLVIAHSLLLHILYTFYALTILTKTRFERSVY